MFSTKKLKKTGTHTLTQCHKTFLSFFFLFLFFSPDSHLSLPLIFLSPFILPKPLTNLANPDIVSKSRTCGADLHRHPMSLYLVRIITQCADLHHRHPARHRSLSYLMRIVISFFFQSVVICMDIGYWIFDF